MVSPLFVTKMGGKDGIVVYYKPLTEFLEPRSLRTDQIGDRSPDLCHGDQLFKADLADSYYHPRLRPSDRIRLVVFVGGKCTSPLR